MLIWCWLQVKDFILNFKEMEVSVEVHKILNKLYTLLFFPFRWRCWWCFGELLLIKQITEDVNLMCISFSVKHLPIFWELWMSLSNMSITYFQYVNICIYPTIDVKTQVENHDEKPKDQRNFYIWTVIFYIDGGISGLIRLFFNQSIN